MTSTIDPGELATVCGGYKILEKTATPEQDAAFAQCLAKARGKWSWFHKSPAQCLDDWSRAVQSNPGGKLLDVGDGRYTGRPGIDI